MKFLYLSEDQEKGFVFFQQTYFQKRSVLHDFHSITFIASNFSGLVLQLLLPCFFFHLKQNIPLPNNFKISPILPYY